MKRATNSASLKDPNEEKGIGKKGGSSSAGKKSNHVDKEDYEIREKGEKAPIC